jgi:dTMP kinase
MDIKWCQSCDIGLPAPDIIIYLDIPVEDASQRGNYGEERYEKTDFQMKVREKFMTLKDNDDNFYSNPTKWYVIDARKSINDIHQEIVKIAEEAVGQVEYKPIGLLWS